MAALAMRERQPLDMQTAAQMLRHIDAHDRDVWVQVGKALAAEFGDAAADLYRDWSEGAANFNEKSCRDTWRSCMRKPGAYTAGTLVALALRGGFKFEAARQPLTAQQRAEQAAARERARQRQQHEARLREQDAVAAQERARRQWRAASRSGASVYAERKGIREPEGCRFATNGALLVPMVRLDVPASEALRGLQAIRPDGSKLFTPGMDLPGACCRLGLLEVGAPLLICEGWATGGSLRMALRRVGRHLPVFVAFNAHNLREVSALLMRMHPSCPQLLCGDDDWQTLDQAGRPLNPGRVAASAARDAVLEGGGRAISAHPVWRGVREPGWTDFNDLHMSRGLDEVAAQLTLALAVMEQLLGARHA